MNLSVAASTANAKDLYVNMEKYFEYEATRKRKGSVQNVPGDLRNILKRYKSETLDPSKQFIMVVLCCMKLMQVTEDNIFIKFQVHTLNFLVSVFPFLHVL